MTLRSRLTLWYAAVLAGGLLLFGSVVYLLLSYSLILQIEDSLLRTADEILLATRRDVRGVALPPLDLTGSIYVQVWGRDTDNSPILVTTNIATHSGAFDDGMLSASDRTFTTVINDGIDLRVLTVPVVILPANQLVGHIQLAASLEPVARARELLLYLMVPGGFLVVFLASVIGWMTAKAALRPLDRVTETALQITRADDLSKRISFKGPPEGEVGRLVVTFNDTLERLENLFQAQRRFLADVSHELRTPLTAIQGNVDIMRRLKEIDEESFEAITSEVGRMTRLVRDLLLLAQAESGKLPLARELVELDTVLLEVYKEAQILGKGKITVKLGPEDQIQVIGDRDRLKQVMLNLIDNAIRYSPPGGEVGLGITKVENWARITVSDQGTGIPKNELPFIFERFYRIDKSRARRGSEGAGLGLSIAYWITRKHGGRIEVASQPGQGTIFSVWIPIDGQAANIAQSDLEREEIEAPLPMEDEVEVVAAD